MAVIKLDSGGRTWKKDPQISSAIIRYGIWIAVILYFIVNSRTIEIDSVRIAKGMSRAGELFSGFFHPDFVSRFSYIVTGVLESITMALFATGMSLIFALILAFGAARNIAPKPVYFLCRLLLVLIRGFHVVVLGILFVVMFGYGPFAGVITIMVNCIGFIGKLMAEEIENIDKTQIEAIKSTGAGWGKTVLYSVWPQVKVRFIGLSIYRADISFRQSTIIGIVGAGGIGAVLDTAMGKYDYNTAGAILLVIIVLVLITEYISSYVRRSFV